MENSQSVAFMEWVLIVLDAEDLNRIEKFVAIAGVALQDAHNEYLMKACNIGRTTLLAAKRKLRDESWIQIGKPRGRGMPSQIVGTTPSGCICDLDHGQERVSDNEHVSEQTDMKISSETERKEGEKPAEKGVRKHVEKGIRKGIEKGVKKGAERVSKSNTLSSPSSPQRNIYSNPPPTPSSPSIPQTGDERNFWSEQLSNDSFDTGVRFENGQVRLINGTRQLWVQRFGSEERLQIVLDGMIGKIRPRSGRPVEHQVITILSEKAAEKIDRDNRYQAAAKRNNAGNYGVDDDLKKMKLIAGER